MDRCSSFIFEALNGEQLRVADLSAAIVMTIPHRANVTILGEYDQYYLIEHDQSRGWILKN